MIILTHYMYAYTHSISEGVTYNYIHNKDLHGGMSERLRFGLRVGLRFGRRVQE